MADPTLPSSIDKKSVNEFKKDLLQMLTIAKGMDIHYAESNEDIDDDIKQFDSLIKNFNKKYKNLTLKLIKRQDSLELKIFLNDKSIKHAFTNSASQILGLQSIGVKAYGTAEVSSPDQITNELNKAKNKLYITYYNPQTGSSKVFLKYDTKSKKVELVYDLNEIENEPSAEFQIAMDYALGQGYNQKIKIYEEASTMGYSLFPDYLRKRKYHEKHDPHLTE